MQSNKSKILAKDKKLGYVDVYIGSIPIWYSYDDIVNLVHTTYFYYERENRDIHALPQLKSNDILRIATLKASNPKFHQQIDFSKTPKTKDQLSDSDSDEDEIPVEGENGEAKLPGTRNGMKAKDAYMSNEVEQASTLYTFVKCR